MVIMFDNPCPVVGNQRITSRQIPWLASSRDTSKFRGSRCHPPLVHAMKYLYDIHRKESESNLNDSAGKA